MVRLLACLSILATGSAGFAAEKVPSYKEAKAACAKEKPELKGKALRSCATDKQKAAKGVVPSEVKPVDAAGETTPQGK